MARRNATLKALSDSYPSAYAMTEIESLEFTNLSPASIIRQRTKYRHRRLTAAFLEFQREGRSRRRSEIASIAAAICLSASAKSQPTPARDPSAMWSRRARISIKRVDIVPTQQKFLKALVSRSRRFVFADVKAESLQEVVDLAAAGKLAVPIAQTVSLTDAPRAVGIARAAPPPKREGGHRLSSRTCMSGAATVFSARRRRRR